jgi:CheY-like chemotaxis protein
MCLIEQWREKMDRDVEKLERRRSFRVPVQGTASLWKRGNYIGNYEVKNLSISGCLLVDTPEWELKQAFILELLIPTVAIASTEATVVRYIRDANGRRFAGMNFGDVSAAFEDSLHDLMVTTLEKEEKNDTTTVMVLHPHAETRHAIVSAISSIGHKVVDMASPIEAIQALKEGKVQVHTLIVSRFIGTCDGQEMMRFMATHFPYIRRVIIGASDALPLKRTTNFAHAIIKEPWNAKNLKKVLPTLKHSNGNRVSESGVVLLSEVNEALTA